jgi:hypothetical protein
MPRRFQFSLKGLLWFALLVVAFVGGISVRRPSDNAAIESLRFWLIDSENQTLRWSAEVLRLRLDAAKQPAPDGPLVDD